MQAASGRTVAILITTYRRNAKLLRLVEMMTALIRAYAGPNHYFICVADSDRTNDVALPPGTSYLVNAGDGFDDNLLGAFRFLSGACDHVFAMADDDLPNPFVDPLTIIDAALRCDERDVVLFNHVTYVESGGITLDRHFYSVTETVNLSADPIPMLSGRMPRYAGVLYRTAFVRALLPQLQALRTSLHAYAAPIYIAADRGRFLFFDHGIVLFDDAAKADGAWESARRVHRGLMQFLKHMAPCLSPGAYRYLVQGLYHVFFRVNRKSVWRTDLPGVPDFATLELFEAHLATLDDGA
ncbi:MAG: hypothetical protein JSR59_19855 [Proteobacteria bacterium]|nr:hypothetical protein [Pseudomonadota bacterium]